LNDGETLAIRCDEAYRLMTDPDVGQTLTGSCGRSVALYSPSVTQAFLR
jgi:hypothetical protein